MKRTLVLLMALAASASAQAQLLVKKGARAQVKVEYVFVSSGKAGTASRGDIREWEAKRVLNITALYVADEPRPVGVMHEPDAGTNAQLEQKKSEAEALQKKMAPAAMDMMKIVEECKEDEACITRRVTDYGSKMQVPADAKQTSERIKALGDMGAPRYQLWRLVSQSGSYQIDSRDVHQTFEMTCTATKVCKSTVTTKGSGAMPAPAGGASSANASMFEIDSTARDVVISLPVALAPLPIERTVETSLPNDKSVGGRGFASVPRLKDAKIQARLPAGRVAASGTQTLQIEGDRTEGGTLTVTWTITSQ